MPMKRILVVPDVHGRLFWKEPVKKYINTVDRVVFLGDYLDPYEGEEGLAEDSRGVVGCSGISKDVLKDS